MKKLVGLDRRLVLSGVQARGENYSELRLRDFVASSSRFINCQFRDIRISQACFGGGHTDSEYVDCTFDGAQFSAIAPGFAAFVRCSFRSVQISNFYCRSVEFVNCVFSGQIQAAYFNGTVPADDRKSLGRSRNRFEGNDFSEATLTDVGFRTGIDLSKQKLPAGSEYLVVHDARRKINAVLKSLTEWATPEEQKKGAQVLQILESQTSDGQEQLFLQSSMFPPALQAAYARVVALLRETDGPT